MELESIPAEAGKTMHSAPLVTILITAVALCGCGTAYKAQPLPFKVPSAYSNATHVGGATVAAEAYVDPRKATQSFGFDIRDAGMLPVQVVFDNKGGMPLVINPAQTFLVDREGQLWPVLQDRFAYERVTRYTQTKQIFKEGAYGGFLGTMAGALIGAAVGVVTGEDVARKAGEGAAAGAAGGAVLGGMGGAAAADQAARQVMDDFQDKSLQNKPVAPGDLAYGFIFFPGEAKSAAALRLQLVEKGTTNAHNLELKLDAK